MNNMKIDKQNKNVAFSEKEHCYWNVNDNKKYISVTTLIHRYTQEFDKEFWSSYKALEKLLPKLLLSSQGVLETIRIFIFFAICIMDYDINYL